MRGLDAGYRVCDVTAAPEGRSHVRSCASSVVAELRLQAYYFDSYRTSKEPA